MTSKIEKPLEWWQFLQLNDNWPEEDDSIISRGRKRKRPGKRKKIRNFGNSGGNIDVGEIVDVAASQGNEEDVVVDAIVVPPVKKKTRKAEKDCCGNCSSPSQKKTGKTEKKKEMKKTEY